MPFKDICISVDEEMAQNLVIVESPAKAKTIGQYLGSDFKVESSFGHIRDLPKKQMGVDIKHDFKPEYAIPEDKQATVNGLKRALKTAKTVWLATDGDREGEAIAWHLAYVLGLKSGQAKRIIFHEITKTAIEDAIKNPRSINQDLVDAQQARRVLDRLVGYELSPVLWRKITRGLSAGRVQSVAVRLIVEREREIRTFKAVHDFKLTAEFKTKEGTFTAELLELLKSKEAAHKLLNDSITAKFTVTDLTQTPAKRSPAPPLTTSSLQQAAASSLGFSVRQTMVIAQKLYEAGLITYMRTDSLNLANSALDQAAKLVTSRFGERYYQRRVFKTTSKLAQEAHEAIRPTDLTKDGITGDKGQSRLYQLIWARTLASQMAPADIERTTVKIADSNHSAHWQAKGEVLKFDGWLKVMGAKYKDDTVLPPLIKGQLVDLVTMTASEYLGKNKARYSEASLVKKLEQLGIGRPSTYAPTISTIQSRGYVEKIDHAGTAVPISVLQLAHGQIKEQPQTIQVGSDRNRLSPTETGEVVTDFLVKHLPDILDYQFTATVEDDFDAIAQGKKNWQAMIKTFYGPFHQTVTKTDKVSRQEATQMRKLGTDPASKRPIFARLARFGPVLQVGETEDETKPRFVAIPKTIRLNAITLDQALDLLKLPRTLGQTKEGESVTADIGPFGPYVRAGKIAASLKDIDPLKVDLKQALALIKTKRDQKAKELIKQFDNSPVMVKNGPYGPYVTDGKRNAPVPKDTKPNTISLKSAQALLEAKGRSRSFRRRP